MGKLWLLALLIFTIGCVEEGGVGDNSKEVLEFSEHAENQGYEEQFEEELKETEIEEEISEVEPEINDINETESEFTVNATDEVEIINESTENQTEKEIREQKHFKWNAKFEIYNSSKDRLLPTEIFEIEKDKILSLISETEYINYTLIYPPRSNLSGGFSIKVTQEGYNTIQKKIMGKSISEYLSKISLYIIIDPEILIDEKILCEKDEDCIAVDDGCCGSRRTSINRNYREQWGDALSKGCYELACAAVASNHFTYSYRVERKCINNTCKLIPSKEQLEQFCSPEAYHECKTLPEDKWYYKIIVEITCREVIELWEVYELCE